jgi:uroporphyrin-III C-methyltransferase/precorrin-2 dehydrogenase/sirohydrochlorin ferrochelatase
VVAAAESRRVFVNAVDDPAHATAYAGGVVRRGGVTIAISTDGRAPAMAGLLREALDAWLPGELDAWMDAADEARRHWKEQRVPMAARRPQLLAVLNALYDVKGPKPKAQSPRPKASVGSVSLVGAGPGDPQLWTLRAVERVKDADLVLYDALVDVEALRQLTSAQLFCVGKRARRDSVPQETIHKLMIRAAKQGKRVVRLKGGDPFVFGRGAEEALALAQAGIPCEVVPGVTTAVAAAELAGIPVTHRGIASGFLVMAGHTADAGDNTLQAIRPNSISVVVMMGVGARAEIAARLMTHGWKPETPTAIVCSMSTPQAWTWTGRLDAIGDIEVPAGAAGVLIVGEVVTVREALERARTRPETESEVRYGSNR